MTSPILSVYFDLDGMDLYNIRNKSRGLKEHSYFAFNGMVISQQGMTK